MENLGHWEYQGICIEAPEGYSHAGVPTPLVISDSEVRIFFSSRDEQGIARPFFVDGKLNGTKFSWSDVQGPVLDIGSPGMFDSDGLLCCSVIRDEDVDYMFYVGFERLHSSPYRLTIGAAITKSDSSGKFERLQITPVIDRAEGQTIIVGGPFVREVSEGRFEAYYSTGSTWMYRGSELVPSYGLSFTTASSVSNLGQRSQSVREPDSNFYALGRPWIYMNEGDEFLLFSRRSALSGRYEQACARIKSPGKLGLVHSGVPRKSGGFDPVPGEGFFAATFRLGESSWYVFNVGDLGRDGVHICRWSDED